MLRSDMEAKQKRKTAAQYVRMSTDMQKYSTDNQIAAIAMYAALHEIDVVKTYVDSGKSGLTVSNRAGLQQLLEDVRSEQPGFEMILVYDVSRWGRFQDTDESAHYEFLCREAGLAICYCAEEFENDGSVSATIIKAVKRAMAAEYSRELSNRVHNGKCRMMMRGFHAGARPGYALRRMLVDENGTPKTILEDGQHKYLHTDRTILVPGPSDEIETVRWIFEQYVSSARTVSSIFRELNARGIPGFLGKAWHKSAVRKVLLNEKYIGNNVFNQTSIRLRSKRIRLPESQWSRAKNVIEPIITEATFLAAQERFLGNLHRISRFELLDHLSALWCRHGKLSAKIVDSSPTCPTEQTFRRLFGSLLEAFQMVGYPYRTRRPIYASVERTIANAVIDGVRADGGFAEQVTRSRRQTRVLVNGNIIVSIHVAHARYKTSDGRPRWFLSRGAPLGSDIAVAATFDDMRHRVLDYYFIPVFLLTNPQQILFDINPIEFEAFRSPSLTPLIQLLRHGNIHSDLIVTSDEPVSGLDTPIRTLRFNANGRPIGSVRILRGFERYDKRVASFAAAYANLFEADRALRTDLISLFKDRDFRKLLEAESLRNIPNCVCAPIGIDLPPHNTMVAQPSGPRDRSLGVWFYRLRPDRLSQIQQMRKVIADPSHIFLKLLIAASKPEEFILEVPASRILSAKERVQIRKRFRRLEERVRLIAPVYSQHAYRLAFTRAYFRTLLSNEHIIGYLRAIHPKINRRLRSLILAN